MIIVTVIIIIAMITNIVKTIGAVIFKIHCNKIPTDKTGGTQDIY